MQKKISIMEENSYGYQSKWHWSTDIDPSTEISWLNKVNSRQKHTTCKLVVPTCAMDKESKESYEQNINLLSQQVIDIQQEKFLSRDSRQKHDVNEISPSGPEGSFNESDITVAKENTEKSYMVTSEDK